jgi:hypothetical protein
MRKKAREKRNTVMRRRKGAADEDECGGKALC